jgi:hypothetical protein
LCSAFLFFKNMNKQNKSNKTEISLPAAIQRLAELGLDESEIAYALGIRKLKFAELKNQKQIADALLKGIQSQARKVEEALYRRATGFEYEELVTAEKPSAKTSRSDKSELPSLTKGGTKGGSAKDGTENSAKSSAKLTLKTVIPDVTACVFWLKNRMPDKWKDPKDINNGKTSFVDLLKLYEEEK